MATLFLPRDPRTAVWSLLRERLKADPVYDQAGIRLVFFEGDRESLAGLETYQGPVVRFLASLGPAKWFDEGSQSGALVVQADAALTTLDNEDVFNLQGAVESTLDSLGDLAFQQQLVDAGAVTGLVNNADPLKLLQPTPGDSGLFRLAGRFWIEVRRPLTL